MVPLGPALRRLLAFAPLALVLALGLAPLAPSAAWSYLALLGLLGSLVGVHATGRAGPAASLPLPAGPADGAENGQGTPGE